MFVSKITPIPAIVAPAPTKFLKHFVFLAPSNVVARNSNEPDTRLEEEGVIEFVFLNKSTSILTVLDKSNWARFPVGQIGLSAVPVAGPLKEPSVEVGKQGASSWENSCIVFHKVLSDFRDNIWIMLDVSFLFWFSPYVLLLHLWLGQDSWDHFN